jgi:hemolysin-activating ACP:hemolysin acyltransferase
MRDILRDTLELWTTQEPFSRYKSQTIAWRLLPAIDNKRIRVYYRGDLCVGFVTWAWFLEKEFDTMKFNGAEVFARNDGDMIYIMDAIIPYGSADVKHVVRDMRRHLSELYPDKPAAFAHRNKRKSRWSRSNS